MANQIIDGVVFTPLPIGASTEAVQNLQLALLTTIDADTSYLSSIYGKLSTIDTDTGYIRSYTSNISSYTADINTNLDSVVFALASKDNKDSGVLTAGTSFKRTNTNKSNEKVELALRIASDNPHGNSDWHKYTGDEINVAGTTIRSDIACNVISEHNCLAITNIVGSFYKYGYKAFGNTDDGIMTIRVFLWSEEDRVYKCMYEQYAHFQGDVDTKGVFPAESYDIPVVANWNDAEGRFGYVEFVTEQGAIANTRTSFSINLKSYTFLEVIK